MHPPNLQQSGAAPRPETRQKVTSALREARPPRASVYFRSLGCPKNQVDTEVMLGALATQATSSARPSKTRTSAVINTCSFIQSAREESIEAILEVADLREDGR